ncbi:sushi, von Willebrand factor type A, EGF and pentraxin domain-containing protein 1 [Tribolium castaneum]|uniref:sushi, von Willebrand factor type A, EGF and pentraxin domain-containing protein 1 n=1 Tax=Tribolium castaneum TaxID=7070 RepID=UPI00046BFC62|nr:PREDICTED: sushi, von Willebrand factor type A, EGF and pentraxin domain-containing protein 1 [Tribolium castaneum]|eukprot:XP_008191829.1 PREDICTED: sushi, von Willebrand factor type A, EGF and pentraxin domain-containing protein 1 [Tribolium castaneum]
MLCCVAALVVLSAVTKGEDFLSVPQDPLKCPDFGEISNGFTNTTQEEPQIVTVECYKGYYLEGFANFYCKDGKWDHEQRPKCNKLCYPPPSIEKGSLIMEDLHQDGMYRKGALATYSCWDGFQLTPKESKYRVCEKGIWTGANATCEPVSCPQPKEVANGYFVQEKGGEFEMNQVGQRLHFSCNSGYVLVGTTVQQCLDDGTWSPKIPPVCSLQTAEDPTDLPCPAAPTVLHSTTTVIQGYQSKSLALAGTVIQIHCIHKYKNARAPCQPGKLRCMGGRWVGVKPICVQAHGCDPPPGVLYADIYNLSQELHDVAFTSKYPIKSQITYQCLPGYTLQGNEVFSCAQGGCWLPAEPPTCYRTPTNNYFLEVNSVNAVLISGATGAGVLGLLLVICLITVCRRRKPLSRAVPIAPPVTRPDLGDHATLLHHPDRLALIPFADGMQNEQACLPSYDEATRDRAPNPTSNRLHRPHWPNLGGRRSRTASTNPGDVVHVTRHGSFASHSPSMGSTDTVAVSEGSTNVTLDTVSSYSGSQPASCRVHCGSLASFDTSSVVNTEGVPLLEESEFEEIQGGDNLSAVVDNPSISDNASFKLSANSADLV